MDPFLPPSLPPTGSTHGRQVEESYSITGAFPHPPLPKGSMKITDSHGKLVCDLDGKEGGREGATQPLGQEH